MLIKAIIGPFTMFLIKCLNMRCCFLIKLGSVSNQNCLPKVKQDELLQIGAKHWVKHHYLGTRNGNLTKTCTSEAMGTQTNKKSPLLCLLSMLEIFRIREPLHFA